MKDQIWDLFKKILGVVLIVGGVLGLFLPFFQGIAMIIAGAVLLGNKTLLEKIKKMIGYFKRRGKR